MSHPICILGTVGYRGKQKEQSEARRLRAKGLTMTAIAERLHVSKGSVSLWTRDVPFQPSLIRTKARSRGPNVLQLRKQEEIDSLHRQVDESRLRLRLYLHEGLDLDEAIVYWSAITGIPRAQVGKPYRAVPDPTIRRAKHKRGCVTVVYSCARTHRAVMGLVDALLASNAIPG